MIPKKIYTTFVQKNVMRHAGRVVNILGYHMCESSSIPLGNELKKFYLFIYFPKRNAKDF